MIKEKISSFFKPKPKKFAEKLLDNVIHNEELFKIVGKNNSLLEFMPDVESLNFDRSRLYKIEDLHDEFQKKLLPFTFSKPFICELDNVELVGPSALMLYKKRAVLENSIGRDDCLQKSVTQASESCLPGIHGHLQNKNIFSSSIVICNLVNVWSKGYFHWLLEGLTRLQMVRRYEKKTSKKIKLLIDQNPPHYVKESLQLLGFEEHDLLYYTNQRNVVKKAILPSFRRQIGYTSACSCQWLKENIFSSLNIGATDQRGGLRIYISRKLAIKRQVINEEELTVLLSEKGFVTVHLEEYSFAEQVKLFSKASFVLAPHGAGLTNIIFSRPDTFVLELFHENYINPCYFTLALAHGFMYYYVIGKEINDNMVVNVHAIERILDEVLVSPGFTNTETDTY